MIITWVACSGRAADCGSLKTHDCALSYVERQDFPPAVRILQQILKQQPRDLKALNLLGIALTGSGNLSEANREFRKAVQVKPGFYPALKNLAVNEFNSNQMDKAKANFERVLEFKPNDDVSQLFLGEIAFSQAQCGPALEHYEKTRTRIVNNHHLI